MSTALERSVEVQRCPLDSKGPPLRSRLFTGIGTGQLRSSSAYLCNVTHWAGYNMDPLTMCWSHEPCCHAPPLVGYVGIMITPLPMRTTFQLPSNGLAFHCDQELARRRRTRTRPRRAMLKSKNPHLAGGEHMEF